VSVILQARENKRSFLMKKQSAVWVCCGMVFSSSLWALSSLVVKESAKVDLLKIKGTPPTTVGTYTVQYAKYNTFNRNLLNSYGVTYESGVNSGVITLDDKNYSDSESWAKAQCVSFVKAVTVNPGNTPSWKVGDPVTNSTPKWTVIADFKGGDTYPQQYPYGHVAILVKAYPDGTARVIDQNFFLRTWETRFTEDKCQWTE